MPKLDTAAYIAAVGLILQAWNAYMFMRIENAILKSEQKVLDKAETLYVRKEVYEATHAAA